VHRVTPRGGGSSRQGCRLPLRPEPWPWRRRKRRFRGRGTGSRGNDAVWEVPTGIQQDHTGLVTTILRRRPAYENLLAKVVFLTNTESNRLLGRWLRVFRLVQQPR
jgi:hypothetical protein